MTLTEHHILTMLFGIAFHDKKILIQDFKSGIKYPINGFSSDSNFLVISNKSSSDENEIAVQTAAKLMNEAKEILERVIQTHLELSKTGIAIDTRMITEILLKLGEWEDLKHDQ